MPETVYQEAGGWHPGLSLKFQTDPYTLIGKNEEFPCADRKVDSLPAKCGQRFALYSASKRCICSAVLLIPSEGLPGHVAESCQSPEFTGSSPTTFAGRRRNMRRDGEPQVVRVKISGHQIDSTERRYNIVDDDDLDIAKGIHGARAAQ